MKRALPLLPVIALAFMPLAAPTPKVTPIFSTVGVRITSPAAARDGMRVYYGSGTVESGTVGSGTNGSGTYAVRMYDRRTRRHHDVLNRRALSLIVSPTGDRLMYHGPGEDNGKFYVWTLALDPKTGLAAGDPRRVSLTHGKDAAFSSDGRSIAFVGENGSGGEQIIIVPVNGGPERTLVSTDAYIWPIRWTPDGQFITYGRSEDSPPPAAKHGIYRIRVS